MSCDKKYKGSSDDTKRRSGSRAKKRKFVGNQHVRKAKECKIDGLQASLDLDQAELQQRNSVEVEINQVSDIDLESESGPATPTSRSAMKLKLMYEVMNEENTHSDDDLDQELGEDESCDDDEGFRIISLSVLKKQISDRLCCNVCHQSVKLEETERSGLGSKFDFRCQNKKCSSKALSPFSSDPLVNINHSGSIAVHSMNRRSALAMRVIGGGHRSLQTFCGLMNLPPPVQKSSFSKIKDTLHEAVLKTETESLSKAGKLEYNLSEKISDDEVRNVDVSVDGTYMTRGFSSKCGVVSVIGCTSGKVLDIGVKSKSCKSCDWWDKKDKNSKECKQWKDSHLGECTLTHEGSSGSIEPKVGVEVFSRSVDKHKLRYTRFIGDGDTNSFKTVSESKPYGDINVEKVECVGHVQKRMGSRLRKLKSNLVGKNLSDGKKISGKGRLTDKIIDEIQTYYGNAIRANKQDLEGMRKAIWAIYFHKLSSDKKSYHELCSEHWCKYKRAEKDNVKLSHDNSLPEAVMVACKPIFRDLSHPDLLKKCLDGYTQNANESLNNLIWKLCPKNKYHGLKTVETAVGLATITFNDGAWSLGSVLNNMKLTSGRFAKNYFIATDEERLKNADRRATEASLEARRARRNARLGAEEAMARKEGFPYARGEH